MPQSTECPLVFTVSSEPGCLVKEGRGGGGGGTGGGEGRREGGEEEGEEKLFAYNSSIRKYKERKREVILGLLAVWYLA